MCPLPLPSLSTAAAIFRIIWRIGAIPGTPQASAWGGQSSEAYLDQTRPREPTGRWGFRSSAARGPPSSILQLGQLASDAEDDAAARDVFAGRGRGPNNLAARLEAVHGRIRAMPTVSPEAHNRLQRALSLTPVQMVAERRQRARGDRKNTVSPLYCRLARKERAYPGGTRELREEPLTRENLWVDGTRPNIQVPRAAHHKCEICKMTKSHPVSSECGHSFCYMCIRVSLETDWKCPVCSVHMLRAPFRHEAEEAFLKAEYPDWQDNSTVEYKWDGLCFPKLVSIIPVEDSP
ncbi:hypothetical protein DFH07DRAFT_773001 [Mycena maculata]|uniref:RING-type domain-containing protein n=1 Tax=Mycena maculata TaxID=230809 RepID=A0AAD7J4B8_9AGAR|nr:hypothetical protein DFH07DRAFT_773001 [Mycena maculata]